MSVAGQRGNAQQRPEAAFSAEDTPENSFGVRCGLINPSTTWEEVVHCCLDEVEELRRVDEQWMLEIENELKAEERRQKTLRRWMEDIKSMHMEDQKPGAELASQLSELCAEYEHTLQVYEYLDKAMSGMTVDHVARDINCMMDLYNGHIDYYDERERQRRGQYLP